MAWFLFLCVAVVLFFFSGLNAHAVELNIGALTYHPPLSLLVLSSFTLGLFLGYFLKWIASFKNNRKAK